MSDLAQRFPGPCVVCGDTDYALSCGGPSICPTCDCGHSQDPKMYLQMRRAWQKAEREREETRAALDLAVAREAVMATAATHRLYYGHSDTCGAALGPYPCHCGHDQLKAALSTLPERAKAMMALTGAIEQIVAQADAALEHTDYQRSMGNIAAIAKDALKRWRES